MRTLLRLILLLSGLAAWSAAALAECPDLRIEETTVLSFGHIAVQEYGGGVVVVSPNGGVATLGDVGSNGGAEPGFIRICGPAGSDFMLQFGAAELDLAGGERKQRPHMVRNLEMVARGAQIRPTGEGEWTGTLGPRGQATIRVGGTLTIPARKALTSLSASFRIVLLPVY
jgi:hypothetical protein